MEKFNVPKKINQILLAFIAIGVVSLAAGFAVDAHRAWAGLLALTFFLLTLALSGGFFAALQFIAGAKWSVVVRRIPETTVMALPVVFVLTLAIVAGLAFDWHHLYHWAAPDAAQDHILHQKMGFLNKPFFIARMIGYFVVWFGLGYAVRQISLKQDETKDPATRTTLTRWSAGYMLGFAYTLIVASMDYVMSLEPHWYSTMFPVYAFAGLAYSGIAAIILFVSYIKRNGGLSQVNEEHLHDLGKFQFMFTVFWAYIAFSQFMLIWYANLPEETLYVEDRLRGEWGIFTALFWILHFAVPFFILLSSKLKRDFTKLARVAWFILFMGWVDVIWMVYGGLYEGFHVQGFPFLWMELGLFFGAVGIFGYIVLNAFSKVNQVPVGDPYLEDSVHFHQTH